MENVKHVLVTVFLVWVKELVSDVHLDITWLKKLEAQLVNANFVMVLVPLALTIQLSVLLVQPATIWKVQAVFQFIKLLSLSDLTSSWDCS